MALDKIPVCVIPGDGIGPDVMQATTKVLDAAGSGLTFVPCEAGEKSFAKGLLTGVPQETLDLIEKHRLVLKGPLGTPIGHGEKSANVTLRKIFDCFGNLRPVREIPGVQTPFSGRNIDFVVVRENVEDLYTGIEHMQTPDVAQCLKLVSRQGCQKIARLGFEVARAENRKSVHCATKANIMKLTEGMMKDAFYEVAKEYPDIEPKHIIIDNCAHQMVISPEKFEVVVSTNMNGDILSDLASGLIGGLGLSPSSNIGERVSIFEAVHGTAPDIAGKGLANPTATLLSAVLLLRHVGRIDIANQIENALYAVYANTHKRTADLAKTGYTQVTTEAFADAVIDHLQNVNDFIHRDFKAIKVPVFEAAKATQDTRTIGADIFIKSCEGPESIGRALEGLSTSTRLKLKMVSNRGMQLYPFRGELPDMANHWHCRFEADKSEMVSDDEISTLLNEIGQKYAWMHIEKLQMINNAEGYTRVQGEN